MTIHSIDDVLLFDEVARFDELLKSRGTICEVAFDRVEEVTASGVLGSLVDAERPVGNIRVLETTGSAVEDGK